SGHGLAFIAAECSAAGCEFFRSGCAQTFSDRFVTRAAAISHNLLRTHLEWRLLGRVLPLSVEGGVGSRALLLLQGAWRANAGKRATLSRPGAVTRRHPGRGDHVPQLPRARSDR